MYVRAGRPAFVRLYVGVQNRMIVWKQIIIEWEQLRETIELSINY